MSTKTLKDFMTESKEEISEDYKEQCLDYTKDAIAEAERIKELFEEMLSNEVVYHSAKHVYRNLEDIADNVENFKDQVEKQQSSEVGYY